MTAATDLKFIKKWINTEDNTEPVFSAMKPKDKPQTKAKGNCKAVLCTNAKSNDEITIASKLPYCFRLLRTKALKTNSSKIAGRMQLDNKSIIAEIILPS